MNLPPDLVEELVAAAAQVRLQAYAPYSRYAVGAALMADDGTLFTGVNVENASFGLSICAERHAVGAAVASGKRSFRALAIVTDSSPPAPPCGACRQVLAEFGDFPVVLANTAGGLRVTSVSELLPLAFSRKSLGQETGPGRG